MSVKIEQNQKRILMSMKEKCIRCVKGSNLIRTLIFTVCIGLVVDQLASSVRKIINIPITTYTHFDFNKTLLYPSVTFCREPAYKHDKLLEYGLYSHPYYTSSWRHFNFKNVTLDDFWENVTYSEQDVFVMYGLNGSRENVNLKSVDGLVHGRCYTITPEVLLTTASKSSGYSITLQHTKRDIETNTGVTPPGYHVYIHYFREPFTEVEVHNGGLVEYLYINTGEEVNVKLTVDQYVKIADQDDPCTYESDYNANECTTNYVHGIISDKVGCSGPWMKDELPRCNSYRAMRNLISSYMSNYKDHKYTDCPRFCRSYLYNAFVKNRQTNYWWDDSSNLWILRSGDAALQTQLYIHFNSMMVSIYEERFNYDWNLFLSDLGGSVGFLLGLSVISLASIVSKFFETFARRLKSSKSSQDDVSTTTTVKICDENEEVKNVDADYIKKFKEWNARNDRLAI